MAGRSALRHALAPLRTLAWRGEGMEPGYLVVGTKRGGSTSVADWITRHPEVAPCRTDKGTHFFDVNYTRGRSWFRSAFPKARAPWRITGEASPYYMFHPMAPVRIAAELPDAKLIMVLRDPVARAWSHHAYETARGRETETFERALDLEPQRLAGEEDRLRRDPAYNSAHFRYHAYLLRGHYADQLERLHRYFPAENILVLQSERAFAHPNDEMGRVWDFLDLSPYTLDDVKAENANRPYGDMPEHLVSRLRDYYRPLNERLYDLPGVDFAWPVN